MSAENIKSAALKLFAEHGYDGTSLASIAEVVGIKKQSIYAHFQGKDDLFLSLLKETFAVELAREQTFLKNHFNAPLHSFLEDSLASFLSRFHHDYRLKFWLRVTFLPPTKLYDQVNLMLNNYILNVESLYLERFKAAVDHQEINIQDANKANLAFSALLDSVGMELIYGDQERAKEKLAASWAIYWHGLNSTLTT